MSASTDAALGILLRSARATDTARRMQGDVETALLQSVVDAAVTLFEAEASSIALFEHEPDRLEFRVAAGAQGAGVIGLSVPPTQGVVGYVFSTAQPIALTDVASDPRFDQSTAQRTGYVPRSIAAVPLVDAGATVKDARRAPPEPELIREPAGAVGRGEFADTYPVPEPSRAKVVRGEQFEQAFQVAHGGQQQCANDAEDHRPPERMGAEAAGWLFFNWIFIVLLAGRS